MSRYESQKRYRQKNKKKNADYQKKYNLANKDKIAKRKREYRANNLEKIKEYHKDYYAQSSVRVRQEDLRLKRRFGISLEEVDVILIKQQHKCPVCGKSLVETKRCVDHSHKTGKVRGILCRNCNGGIGLLGDNPESLTRAIKYLEGLK